MRDEIVLLHQRLDFLEWLIRHPDAHENTPDTGWFLAVRDYGAGNAVFGVVRHRDGREVGASCPRCAQPLPHLAKSARKEIAKWFPEPRAGEGEGDS
jgi:hypothetical protein